MARHPARLPQDAAHPSQGGPDVDRQGQPVVDRVVRAADRRPVRSAQQTRARIRRVDLDLGPGHRRHPLVGDARVPTLRHGARGAGRGDDHDRSRPGRQSRDIGQRFRGEGAWRGRVAPTRRPPAAFPLLEAPPSAPARPLAARRTGRAALPSATFPHTLPANRQNLRPLQYSLRGSDGVNTPRAQPDNTLDQICAAFWQFCNVTRSPEARAIHLTLAVSLHVEAPGQFANPAGTFAPRPTHRGPDAPCSLAKRPGPG